MQRARQIELERIALERDRLAQLQKAQLQQTEMVQPIGGRSAPPTDGRGGVTSDDDISSGYFSAEV